MVINTFIHECVLFYKLYRKNREGNYDTADTEMNNNPAYVANIYDSID